MAGLNSRVTSSPPTDLVIVRKDPLRNLRALHAIRWTIKDGVAHTPAEWLSS